MEQVQYQQQQQQQQQQQEQEEQQSYFAGEEHARQQSLRMAEIRRYGSLSARNSTISIEELDKIAPVRESRNAASAAAAASNKHVDVGVCVPSSTRHVINRSSLSHQQRIRYRDLNSSGALVEQKLEFIRSCESQIPVSPGCAESKPLRRALDKRDAAPCRTSLSREAGRSEIYHAETMRHWVQKHAHRTGVSTFKNRVPEDRTVKLEMLPSCSYGGDRKYAQMSIHPLENGFCRSAAKLVSRRVSEVNEQVRNALEALELLDATLKSGGSSNNSLNLMAVSSNSVHEDGMSDYYVQVARTLSEDLARYQKSIRCVVHYAIESLRGYDIGGRSIMEAHTDLHRGLFALAPCSVECFMDACMGYIYMTQPEPLVYPASRILEDDDDDNNTESSTALLCTLCGDSDLLQDGMAFTLQRRTNFKTVHKKRQRQKKPRRVQLDSTLSEPLSPSETLQCNQDDRVLLESCNFAPCSCKTITHCIKCMIKEYWISSERFRYSCAICPFCKGYFTLKDVIRVRYELLPAHHQQQQQQQQTSCPSTDTQEQQQQRQQQQQQNDNHKDHNDEILLDASAILVDSLPPERASAGILGKRTRSATSASTSTTTTSSSSSSFRVQIDAGNNAADVLELA